MAVGMSCIPTLREELLRLRQAELLDEVDALQLELMARDPDERRRERSGRRSAEAAPTRSHRRWPARLAHTH